MKPWTLVIGLVNNMAGAALQRTETQFRDMLAAAGAGCDIRLELFCLPGRSYDGAARQRVDTCYRGIDGLFDTELDGLIVTGMEPRASSLRDEACWPAFAGLVEQVAERDLPTIWSCLAAHGAVLQLSDIERRRRPAKLSGLHATMPVVSDHPLAAGLPRAWWTPHSRHYDVAEGDLVGAGYTVLSRARAGAPGDDTLVDAFAMDGVPSLFLQGHPEYDSHALLREYVRDARRYLTGRAERYPAVPTSYIADDVAAAFMSIAGRAIGQVDRTGLELELDDAVSRARVRGHHEAGRSLMANWLAMVQARVVRPERAERFRAEARP